MTALNSDRYVKELGKEPQGRGYGAPANATFYYGQILMKGSDDGLIKPVSGSKYGVCVGWSDHYTYAFPSPTYQRWLVPSTGTHASGCGSASGRGRATT
jgi:hypothetical protein